MATYTIAPGVARDDTGWGYNLHGTKAALLEAGLARAEWFPTGERNKRGQVVRSKYLEHEGRQIMCREEQHGGRYWIRVSYADGELEAADEALRSLLDRVGDGKH